MGSSKSAAFISTSNSIENSNQFRKIALEIADLGTSVGIKIVPFYHPSLIFFSKLDFARQGVILSALQTYLNIYKSVIAEGYSVLNSSRVVWNALLQLGYRPTSDLFSYIRDEHIIEIHDLNLVQVFRNLSFFNYCSYSLEELYCNQMTDLYTRDPELEKKLLQFAPLLYSGTVKNVIEPQLEPHIIEEKMSTGKLAIFCKVCGLAPLYASSGTHDGVAATMTIEQADIVQVPEQYAEVIPLSSLSAGAKSPEL